MRKIILLFFVGIASLMMLPVVAQNKYGNNLNSVADASLLELESLTKGLRLTRIVLNDVTQWTLDGTPVSGMVIFNDSGTAEKGIYYWDTASSKWVRVVNKSELSSLMDSLTTNSNALTQSGGLVTTVNGQTATTAIASGTAAQILGFDATGKPVYQSASAFSSAWNLGGNTNGVLQTIGTNNAYDLPVVVGGTEAMRVLQGSTQAYSAGDVAIGTTTAATVASRYSNSTAAQQLAKLTVAGGDASINGMTVGQGGGQNSSNVAIGLLALYSNTTGYGNTAMGQKVLTNNTTGRENTAIGLNVLYVNATGIQNTGIGAGALSSNTTAQNNTGIGVNALILNTTGNNNTAVGIGAGGNQTAGDGNIVIGSYQALPNPTGSYQLNIGGAIFGTGLTNNNNNNYNYPSVPPVGNIGIGTVAPAARLTVSNGGSSTLAALQLKAPFKGAVTDSLLTWNPADSTVRKISASGLKSSFWGLTGNSGTTAGTNFIGTTDAQDFVTKVNSIEAMRVLQGTSQANSAGDVAIGTTTAATVASAGSNSTAAQQLAKLTVAGGDAGINGITVGRGGGQVSSNVAMGNLALYSNTTGYSNTANGYQTLAWNTTGYYNTANGYNALNTNTSGIRNTANGSFTLNLNATGNANTANGYSALGSNTTGGNNTANGSYSLSANTTGGNNTATGYQALYANLTGNSNVAIGYLSGSNLISGDGNIAIGAGQLFANTSGSNQLNIGGAIFGTGLTGNTGAPAGNIGIGTAAPANTLEVKSTTAGTSGVRLTNLTNAALATNANGDIVKASPNTANGAYWGLTGNSGTSASANFIGTTDDNDLIFKRGGQQAGWLNSSQTSFGVGSLPTTSTGAGNTAFGYGALAANTTGTNNTAFGYGTLAANTTGNTNVAIGRNAGMNNTTGASNVSIGWFAGKANKTGISNLAIGTFALFSNTDSSNVAVGVNTLINSQTGSYNTVIGDHAMQGLITGSSNVAIGNMTGDGLSSGSHNIFIGNNAKPPKANLTTASNLLNIGNIIFGTGVSSDIPDSPAGNIGIGTSTPRARLTVSNGGSSTLAALQLQTPLTGAVTDSLLTWNPADSTVRKIPNTLGIKVQSASYTAQVSDYTIICKNTGAIGDFTLTLPASTSANKGKIYQIMVFTNDITLSSVSPVLDAAGLTLSGLLGSKTLLGSSVHVASGGKYTLQSDGVGNWYVIGN